MIIFGGIIVSNPIITDFKNVDYKKTKGQIMLSDPKIQEILMDITNDEKSSNLIIECILKSKTSDLEIAEETEIKLNTVRKILYKLFDTGIATYTQDPETNWYNWKFEQNNVSI
jgi:transcription initiation factor TFIIE subunit alpha